MSNVKTQMTNECQMTQYPRCFLSSLSSLCKKGGITSLWQMIRLTHHPELVEGEGRGEIFKIFVCLMIDSSVDRLRVAKDWALFKTTLKGCLAKHIMRPHWS